MDIVESTADQPAIDPRLVVVSDPPPNAELPLELLRDLITPTELFFHRNRFERPSLGVPEWRLVVGGAVERPFALDYDRLRAMPSRTLRATLECAGNGRAAFSPAADGEQWGYGAVSTAEWTGVSLAQILEEASVKPEVCEILASGADGGEIEDRGTVRFQRSLPLEKALHPDTLVAYAMNGETLTPPHGHPARLVVPGWYGVASVKWLADISALTEPFTGYFQRERYIVPAEDGNGIEPLTSVVPRSLIVSPRDGDELDVGSVRVTGLAWSGFAPVERVEISTDGGRTWSPAQWTSDSEPYAWRAWEFWWEPEPGMHELQSRATDASGRSQPQTAPWNKLGYANNSIHSVRVRCRPKERT